MLFGGLLCFLFLIIVRPQDFLPGFMGTRIVLYVMGSMLVAWLVSDVKKDILRTQLDKFIAFFLIWCAISTINTQWISYVAEISIEQLKLLLIYFFVVTVINTKSRFNFVLWYIVVLMVGVALMGVLQAHDIDLTGAGRLWAADKEIWQIRGAGNFDNPNDLAYSVVLIVPFVLGKLVEGPGIAARLFSFAALATAIYCIYLTHSRGGTLALVVCIALWFLSWVKSSMVKRVALVGSLCVVLVAFSLQTSGYREDRSSMGRVDAWVAGMEMLQSHPILGVGKNQFREHYIRDSHNSYVRAGAETGLIGLYAFVGILYTLFQLLKRPEYSSFSGEMQIYYSGFIGYFASFVVGSIFSTRTYDIVFLVMTAILGAFFRVYVPPSVWMLGKLWNGNVLLVTLTTVVVWKIFLIQVW